MPSDGQRWHDIRAGDIYLKSGDLHEVITAMMKHSPQERPSASRLLHISAVLDKLI